MRIVKDGWKTAAGSTSKNRTGYSSDMADGYFHTWHPFKHDWLEGLSEDMKVTARTARQSLVENKRNERSLARALLQIRDWRSNGMRIANPRIIPKVIRQEQLGCQLELEAFIKFLLTHKKINGFRNYEFAALAILQEIHGLTELQIMASKNDFNPSVQYLTLRITRLYAALFFLRMMSNLPQKQYDICAEITICLFRDRISAS